MSDHIARTADGDQLPVAGLLLAAGAGRRMGMPKALVRGQEGLTFVERAIAVLFEGGCDHVTVVVGASAEEVEGVLATSGWLTHPEVGLILAPDWAEGMGASLRAGLLSLGGEADAVVVGLVDLPDVDARVVQRVLERVPPSPDILGRATYDGKPGHPVVLGRNHWNGVAASAQGDQGARTYLSAHEVVLVDCSDLATGRDVDRPHQLDLPQEQ